MSPAKDPTRRRINPTKRKRKGTPRKRSARMRQCLLKGCETRFRPARAGARYCGEECRRKARQWSQWKSRQRYRKSEQGRRKRRESHARYRKKPGARPVRGARGSSPSARRKKFFRSNVRSSRLLREILAEPAIAAAAVLQLWLPPRDGAGLGTGGAVEIAAAAGKQRLDRELRPGPEPRTHAGLIRSGHIVHIKQRV
jgi:hypothetical protein